MKPPRTVLTPTLERWSLEAGRTDRRQAIVRVDDSSDITAAAARLEKVGAEIQSKGHGSITVVVTPSVVRSLAQEPWILAVTEPRRLFPAPVESSAPPS